MKQGTFKFCFVIVILTSFNLFSQENKMISEEKYQERLRKHKELQLAEKESHIVTSDQNLSDSIKFTSPIKNYNSSGIDSSFPTFVDTGNPEQDNLNYRIRKDLWIKENPESYKKMHESVPLTEEQKREIEIKKELRLNKQ